MKTINDVIEKKYGNYPEKVLQFGEGNFLRAFVDWMIDKANREASTMAASYSASPSRRDSKT